MPTPKEIFDATVMKIKADTYASKGITQEVVDELDDDVKHVEELMEQDETEEKPVKTKKDILKILVNMNDLKKTSLTEDQKSKLKSIYQMFEDGKLENTMVMNLIELKISTFKNYESKQEEAKELQLKLMEDISRITEDLMKIKGILEFIDKEILKFA